MYRPVGSSGKQRRRGVALLEVAVLLPLLLFLTILSVDFGRVCYDAIVVSNSSRNGAVYAGTDRTHSLDTTGVSQIAKAEATNLDTSQVLVTVTPGTDSAGGACVDVVVTSRFECVSTDLLPGPLTVSSRIRTRVAPVTPGFN